MRALLAAPATICFTSATVTVVDPDARVARREIAQFLICTKSVGIVKRANLLDCEWCDWLLSQPRCLNAAQASARTLDLPIEPGNHLRQHPKGDLAIASQHFQQFTLAESIAQFSRYAHPCMESTARILMKVPNLACHDMLVCMRLYRRSM